MRSQPALQAGGLTCQLDLLDPQGSVLMIGSARPGRGVPSPHSMKNGSAASATACSIPASRHRSTWPSSRRREPVVTASPRRPAITSSSCVRTAQPSGRPEGAAATQRPNGLPAASAMSTAATSSR
jgi:hypothetical protein